MEEIIASDLDGVIAYNPLKKFDYPSPYAYYRACTVVLEHRDFLPQDVIIITGRKQRYIKVTMEWLLNNKIGFSSIHFLPFSGRIKMSHRMEWKAEIIDLLSVEKYYEDDTRIVKYLRENTEAEIVHVLDRKEEIRR